MEEASKADAGHAESNGENGPLPSRDFPRWTLFNGQDNVDTGTGREDVSEDSAVPADTAWLEDLSVHDCPGAPEEALVVAAVNFSAYETFYGRGVSGFYLDIQGTNYSFGSGCGTSGMYDAVYDGSIADASLFALFVTLPYADDPMDFQGVYPLEVGADMWGRRPAQQFVIGWYDETEGYQHISSTSATAESYTPYMEFCLSRVRPGRISGTALIGYGDGTTFTTPGPYFLTFDGIDTGGVWPEDCVGAFYEYGATEENVWDEDVNTP